MPDCGPAINYPDNIPPLPDSMDITVGNRTETFSNQEFLFSVCRIEFYLFRSKQTLLYVDSQPQAQDFHDYWSPSYNDCPTYFCNKDTNSDCSKLTCHANHQVVWDMTVSRNCHRTDKVFYCTKNNYWTQKIQCMAGLDDKATCSPPTTFKSVAGVIDNHSYSLTGDKSKDEVVYAVGPQWRSRGTADNQGDIFCHYQLPLETYIQDPTCGVYSPGACLALTQWIQDFKNNADLPTNLQSIMGCYVYLYSWSFFFYGTLFRFPGNNYQTSLTDGGSRLRQIVVNQMNVHPDYDKDVTTDSLFAFSSSFLPYPQPIRGDDGSYFLTVSMDYQSFASVASQGNLPAMNNAIGSLLSHFFQEENLIEYVQGKTIYPNKSEYTLLSASALQTIPGNYSFQSSVWAAKDPDPFGFNTWLVGDHQNPYDWNAVLQNYQSLYRRGTDQIFFIPTFVLQVRIEKWNPILVAYCAAANVIFPTTDLCQQIFQQTNMQIDACNNCKTADQEACKQSLPLYCSTSFSHGNPSIQSLLFNNTLNRVSVENQCQCYNSELPPPNRIQPGNPVAMCFNKYCNDSDLQLVGATDAFCQQNCRTVDEWVHPKDPSMVSKNPGALNEARFNALCGQYKPKKISWNVLVNGLVITGCVVGLCIFYDRKWLGISLGVVLLAVVLFLSFDLVVSSYCTDKGKPFTCRTAITQIPFPRYVCDYRYCDCFFNSDCPTSCVCGSGLCIPHDYGVQKMTTQQELRVQCNVPLLLSIVLGTATYVVILSTLWPTLSNKVRYPTLSTGVVATVIASVFLISFFPYSVYSGSCVVEKVPMLAGTYNSTQTQIVVSDTFFRQNLLFLCPVQSTQDVVVVSNSNMYTNQEKAIEILTLTIPQTIPSHSYFSEPTTTTSNGSYLLLSDGNVPDLSGWAIQRGIFTGSPSPVEGKVVFDHAFQQTPLVWATPQSNDRSGIVPVIQIQYVDTQSFTYRVVVYDANQKQWVLASSLSSLSLGWMAMSQEQNPAIPVVAFQEFGTSPLRSVDYQSVYQNPPLVLLALNTNDYSTVGIISLGDRTEKSFSWNIQTTLTSDPTTWVEDHPSMTMQYLVTSLD